MKTILISIPSYGFDPTEAAIPWKILKSAGHKAVFATPAGRVAKADVRMVTGQDLPTLLKKTLMATPEAVQTYFELEQSKEFQTPISYSDINPESFDGVLLPGGHDKGMREYLESEILQKSITYFFDHRKPVGAICHGTLLAGRTISREDPARTGKSVLYGRKTTGLTKNQEMIAYFLTCMTLGDYYRTYEVPMADELISFLRIPNDFSEGPGFPIPMGRDSMTNLSPGYTVLDGTYLSARWPGDAHKFGMDFVKLLARA